MTQAEDDRKGRPWLYYELDRETLIRMLNEQADKLAKVAAQASPPTTIRAHLAGCGHALSIPVDQCPCGGRDVVLASPPTPEPARRFERMICPDCTGETMIHVRSIENTFWCDVCKRWKPCPSSVSDTGETPT